MQAHRPKVDFDKAEQRKDERFGRKEGADGGMRYSLVALDAA